MTNRVTPTNTGDQGESGLPGFVPPRIARPGLPEPQGLYDPAREHDNCGIGFVVNIHNKKSRQIVEDGLAILSNLEHRGAVGADPMAGDGCGMLVQIPHAFFKQETARLGFDLPEPGHYGVGHLFMPHDDAQREKIESTLAEIALEEGLEVIGWRDVPVDDAVLGETVKPTEPVHRQVFIARGSAIADEDTFERKLYVVRKLLSNRVLAMDDVDFAEYYVTSCSARIITYKGMFLAPALAQYYPDLQDPGFTSALALVHQRFSTNTFPSWSLAQPFRQICHNGEINTLRGNMNWMNARYANMSSDVYGDDMGKVWPISYEGQSDSACFDNALELLYQGGYSLAHAMMMLIPEAWHGNPLMDDQRRAFYEHHAALMEPWDGPAAIAFTDGKQIGATLDRNGLRPARYLVTDDGMVVMSSEMGVLPVDERRIVSKWRLQPGKMLLIDLEEGRIISDEDLKAELSGSHPYQEWLDRTQILLKRLPAVDGRAPRTNASLLDRQQAFGYTQEDMKFLMTPMAHTGQEAVGSMGTDTPISALSSRPKLLHTYFKQLFAQVTNPPIDPIREELVMSLVSFIGPRPNLLDLEGTSSLKRLEVSQPILKNEDLEKIRTIGDIADNHFQTLTLDITYAADKGKDGMKPALDRLCERAQNAVGDGYNIIILSDRLCGPERIPIPSLLATSAVHHHLIRRGLRTSVGLVVETGEAREIHQFCTLAGYGAEAINPYLAFETLEDLLPQLDE
ncbi:MAG: glutamate synthase central domain-containing protein, partial [Hyphomicrobiales bacterium]